MISCAVTTSFLGCLVTSYLFFRYTWCLDLSALQLTGVYALFLVAGCIPLLVSYQMENYLGKFYTFYRYGLYTVFIGCIILFTLTLLTDVVLLVISHTSLAHHFKHFCRYINPSLITAAVLCSFYALYAGTKVPDVKEVVISSDKLNEEKNIVLLSDIHIHRAINPEKVRKIVDRINALAPDIILLDGDIIDDDVNKVSDITALLKNLQAKQGIWFVTGNHEFYAGYQETVAELQKSGFRFLENNGVSLGDIYLAGLPDLFSGQRYGKDADIAQTFSQAKDQQFKLLMSHTPADFGKNNNFDLEVSGHTHGGQIFPFHILTKLHNRYLAGLYQMENGAQIYVTRGSGQWGPQMRFLAPSEITVIRLVPKA